MAMTACKLLFLVFLLSGDLKNEPASVEANNLPLVAPGSDGRLNILFAPDSPVLLKAAPFGGACVLLAVFGLLSFATICYSGKLALTKTQRQCEFFVR